MKESMYKTGWKIIIPNYVNEEKTNSTLAAKLLSKFGVNFERQFSVESYKNFFIEQNIAVKEFRMIEGHMPCVFAIIDNNREDIK